jgi:hypothetical protein
MSAPDEVWVMIDAVGLPESVYTDEAEARCRQYPSLGDTVHRYILPTTTPMLTELQRERLEVALATENAWLGAETLGEVIGREPGMGFARSVIRFLLAFDAKLRGAA